MLHQKILPAALASILAVVIWTGCQSARSNEPAAANANDATLKPGPNDPQIAFVAVRLLESYHYLHHPLDREMSAKIFDGYLNSLDPRHENFLQADLNEFAPLRTNLDMLLLGNHGAAQLEPAFAIYTRYTDRVRQHTDYANDLLREDKFRFNTDEKFILDRKHEPFPSDLAAAKQLWREQLRAEYLQEKLAKELTNGVTVNPLPPGAATNIIATLEKRYRSVFHAATNADSDAVLQAFLNFGLAHAYDPHTDYFSAPKAQDFSIDMNLALIGIGAQLQEDDGFCKIVELVPGGPAMKCKQLKPGDRIVAVAQGNSPPVDVVNMELGKIVQMIRGQKDTEVRLTITPAENNYNSRRVVTLVREEIKLEDKQAKSSIIEYPDGQRIGIVDLPSFYAPIGDGTSATKTTPKYTSVDVAMLLKKLKKEKVSGVILDLRSNPGGSLEEAVKFTGLFINSGPVVQQRDSSGKVVADAIPEPGAVYDGPLMVMLNRFSASASEIAAAALQDYGRAVIVGDTSTHGKGSIQQLQPLRPFVWPATASATNDPGVLKITKGKFYRISGGSTQMKGVTSDIVLPDIWNYSTLVGEGALDNAMDYDTIAPCDYDKLNLVQPFLPELERRSLSRIATNRDFAYIRQDIEEFEKKQAENSTTLNEQKAIAEREQESQRIRDQDKEREARPLPAVKIYNVTLDKDTGLPSAPELQPLFTTNYNSSPSAEPKFFISKANLEKLNESLVKSGQPDASKTFDNLTILSTNAPTAFVFTNFFNAELTADFEDYCRSNFPEDKIIRTGSTTTNYIAEIVSPTATNQIAPAISKSVPHDPALEESENIMRDYISLLSKSGMLTTTH